MIVPTFSCRERDALERPFIHLARSDRQHDNQTIGIFGHKLTAVQRERQLGEDVSGPLVAVDEGMVTGDAEAIGRRQLGCIGLVMNGEDEALLDLHPVLVHFASSRSTLRRRLMISRAASSCRATVSL